MKSFLHARVKSSFHAVRVKSFLHAARVTWLLVLLAACGGSGGESVDASTQTVCMPEGPYQWPVGCDYADCRGKVCDVTCHDGTQCGTLDCTGAPQCRLTVEANTTCGLTDCTNTGTCFVACFSACEVQCTGSKDCGLECEPGTPCLLRCGTSTSCGFQGGCTGGSGMIDCGNGVLACNRPCP